jgi:molybdopterin converting factor small subunit
MLIHVNLHTILQRQKSKDRREKVEINLPDGSTVADLIKQLGITLPDDALLVIIRNHLCDPHQVLSNEDTVDLIPALSGGMGIKDEKGGR